MSIQELLGIDDDQLGAVEVRPLPDWNSSQAPPDGDVSYVVIEFRVPSRGGSGSVADAGAQAGDWAAALRNALVHEGRLHSLVNASAPGLEVDTFLAMLGDVLEGTLPTPSETPERHFTDAELAELRHEGVELSQKGSEMAVARTVAEHAGLVAQSLSVADAAKRLGVDESRIRQRLASRSLYGLKIRGSWRLPLFQFSSAGEIPGLGNVLVAIPAGVHPVAVQRWLSSPSPDLELDGHAVSPLAWLEATSDHRPLVEIAQNL